MTNSKLSSNSLLYYYFVVFEIAEAFGIKHCYQCSDANIETHYGAFFVNPRVLQDGNRNELVKKCDRFDVPLVMCDSTCFTLNVTSLHVKDRKVMPFGSAYGCSEYVLSDDTEEDPLCTKKDIILRTTPPYLVQAEYCKCNGDLCNRINHIVTIPRRKPSGRQKFFVPHVVVRLGATDAADALLVEINRGYPPVNTYPFL